MNAVLAAARALLTSLDPLSYRQRMNRLAAWARTAPDRAEVCADLRGRGPYERQLALVAAMVARDTDGIAAATRDPQPSIRAARSRRRCVPESWPAIMPTGRRWSGGGSIGPCAAGTRRRPADALMTVVRAEFGDEEAAALLPACGADTVRALLPDLEHALNLEQLVRWHPGPLLDRVRARPAAARPSCAAGSGATPPARCCGVTRHRRSTCWSGMRRRSRCPARSARTGSSPHTTRVASPACSPRPAARPGCRGPRCRRPCCAASRRCPPTSWPCWPAGSANRAGRWRHCSAPSRRRGAGSCTTGPWPRPTRRCWFRPPTSWRCCRPRSGSARRPGSWAWPRPGSGRPRCAPGAPTWPGRTRPRRWRSCCAPATPTSGRTATRCWWRPPAGPATRGRWPR